MDKVEFHCQKCSALLRVRQEDQSKLIRCPQCEHLQRYTDADVFRPIDDSGTSSQRMAATERWSLRGPDGAEYRDLDRAGFEQMLRKVPHAGSFFIGGEYSSWTPVDQLFQSTTRPRSTSPPSTYTPGPVTSYTSPPPLEQQRPDGWGTWVLVLGVLGLLTYCVPVLAIAGMILGVIESIRMGNGDISTRYSTRLVIGLLICLLALMLSFCGCRIDLG